MLANVNCKNNNFNAQGHWIGIFRVEKTTYTSGAPSLIKNHEGYYIDTVKSNSVLSFNRDTLVLTNFNETFYHGFTEYRINFDLEKDSIRTEYENKKIPIKYSFLDENVLVWNGDSNRSSKHQDHFIQVKEFEMANKKDEISSFLTSHPILLNERTDKIELIPPHWHHMGEFIQDSLEANYGDGNDWYFYSLKNELFLIIGDQLIHVSDFDHKKLYGYTYHKKNSEVRVTQSSYSKKINIDQLFGKWNKLESPTDKNNIKKNLNLEISSKKIIVNSKNFSDTLRLNLNKYKNKIRIEDSHNDRHGKYWKIDSLSKDQLVLKIKYENDYSPIEVMRLKKE